MPSVLQKAGQVVDTVGLHVQHAAQSVEAKLEATTNQLLPRTRREHMLEQAHDYAHQNPKAAVPSPQSPSLSVLIHIHRPSWLSKPHWLVSHLSSFLLLQPPPSSSP